MSDRASCAFVAGEWDTTNRILSFEKVVQIPPPLEYDPSLVLALSRADAALSELSGLGRTMPNSHLLIGSYMRQEAVLSSRIEGTQASLSDLLLDEVEAGPRQAPGDVREVRNYVVALEHGINRLSELLHEQFEAIHPFLDGNGRVGRLLIALFLIERNRLSQPLLYISEYIEAHRQVYYDLLQRVRTHGDWKSWLHFFLRGVEETAYAAVVQAGALSDLRASLGEALEGKPRELVLLDGLFMNPYLTVSRAAKLLRVSAPTARRSISALQQARILEEITGRAWGRVYVAAPILRALERV